MLLAGSIALGAQSPNQAEFSELNACFDCRDAKQETE